MLFRQRCVEAVQDAVLLGVKAMIVVLMTLWAVSWLVNDYGVVRQRALAGQRAFDYIQKVVLAHKDAPKP